MATPLHRLSTTPAHRYILERELGAGGRTTVYWRTTRERPQVNVVVNWVDELRTKVPR